MFFGVFIIFFGLNFICGLGFLLFVFMFKEVEFFLKLLGSFFIIEEMIKVVRKIFKGCVINVFWKKEISMDESYWLEIFFFYVML